MTGTLCGRRNSSRVTRLSPVFVPFAQSPDTVAVRSSLISSGQWHCNQQSSLLTYASRHRRPAKLRCTNRNDFEIAQLQRNCNKFATKSVEKRVEIAAEIAVIRLEAQQRYFSYRAILVAMVSQNYFVLVLLGHRTIIER